jgi:hypothetical protein
MESVPHDKHGEDGKFTATYDPDEFVTAVDAPDLPTTADVAERVDCPHRTALHHLNKLEDQDRVSSRKIGPAKVWRVDDEQTPSERRERGVTPSEDTDDGTDAHDGASTGTTRERSAAVSLDDVDFPDSRNRADCLAAVDTARAYLKEHGGGTMRDLVTDVMPMHSLGYDVDAALDKIEAGERYRAGWWRLVVRPGLKAAPDIEKPPRGGSEWTYTGDSDQDTDDDPLDESGPYDPTDEWE